MRNNLLVATLCTGLAASPALADNTFDTFKGEIPEKNISAFLELRRNIIHSMGLDVPFLQSCEDKSTEWTFEVLGEGVCALRKGSQVAMKRRNGEIRFSGVSF